MLEQRMPGRLRAASATTFRGCKLELLNGLDSSIACRQGSTLGMDFLCPFPASPSTTLGELGALARSNEAPITPACQFASLPSTRYPFISTRRKSPGVCLSPWVQCVMFGSRRCWGIEKRKGQLVSTGVCGCAQAPTNVTQAISGLVEKVCSSPPSLQRTYMLCRTPSKRYACRCDCHGS